ncbi:hypothetical protein Ddye_011202 [Dipteronia dyeriana]|uniref:RNase H type-1 domain-containing protein n=1 Tax=Dipteronia dyeriana TaxID=168575 RepID=A0AAD9X1R3_9ROSI|nr:hypothetical protein Ddye_011202 [Dipteronia dyeriana]
MNWDRDSLEESFSKEEVWFALSSCDGSKAPGPDGFNLKFIKENWDNIQDDFMRFMEFRPISLVGSMYKVLAKVLAIRMRKVMDKVIGESQMAFVGNRQLLDSFITAQGIIDHLKNCREGGLVVKLDFEKAYDSLDHNFLDSMLERMRFGERWRQWIRHCITTPMLSVLVNGRPTRQFGVEKGLRQRPIISISVQCGYGRNSSSDSITTLLWNIKDGCSDSNITKKKKAIEWEHPPNGSFKFNMDGSARGSPSKARIGGVLRDHRGEVLCLFSTNVGIQDAVTAEILALAKACKLCIGKPALLGRNIEFVSDSMVVVSWINGKGIGSIKHVQTIYDISSLLNSIGRVVYCSRMSNSLADMLAKQAGSLVV